MVNIQKWVFSATLFLLFEGLIEYNRADVSDSQWQYSLFPASDCRIADLWESGWCWKWGFKVRHMIFVSLKHTFPPYIWRCGTLLTSPQIRKVLCSLFGVSGMRKYGCSLPIYNIAPYPCAITENTFSQVPPPNGGLTGVRFSKRWDWKYIFSGTIILKKVGSRSQSAASVTPLVSKEGCSNQIFFQSCPGVSSFSIKTWYKICR